MYSRQDAIIERLAARRLPPRAVAEIGTDSVYKMIILCEDDAIAQRLRPKLEPLPDAGAELTGAARLHRGGADGRVEGDGRRRAARSLGPHVVGRAGDRRRAERRADAARGGHERRDGEREAERGDAAQFGCAWNADDGWVEAMERFVLS